MLDNGSTRDIALQALRDGTPSLRRAGLDKAIAGITSLTEVLAETEHSEDRCV
jgi:type II secretory ATPase GspE/PulE/Tfp pilus assembly ATPase PilB-like protein